MVGAGPKLLGGRERVGTCVERGRAERVELCKGFARCITVSFVSIKPSNPHVSDHAFLIGLVSFQISQLIAFSQCAMDENRAFQEILSPGSKCHRKAQMSTTLQ